MKKLIPPNHLTFCLQNGIIATVFQWRANFAQLTMFFKMGVVMNIWHAAGLVIFLLAITAIIVIDYIRRKRRMYVMQLPEPEFSEYEYLLDEILLADSIDELLILKKLSEKGSVEENLAELIHEEFSVQEVTVAGNDAQKLIMAAKRAPRKGEARRSAVANFRRLHIPVIRPSPEE